MPSILEMKKRVAIVVLGDFGRSPRMQLQAASFMRQGLAVDVIAYRGASAWLLANDADVQRHSIEAPSRATGVLSAISRGLALKRALARAHRAMPRPDLFLVQAPPSVPSLDVVTRFAATHATPVAVDWHNLTRSLLALRHGRMHPLPIWAGFQEMRAARRCQLHLAVSERMRDHLKTKGLEAGLLIDRPAAIFRERPDDVAAVRARLEGPKDGRRTLLVGTATSFTLDEDLRLLLEVAPALGIGLAARASSVHVAVVISGKGERRAEVAKLVASASTSSVSFALEWFEGSRYISFLHACDYGLSLHRSASGLDFPMKICDMWGAGRKVVALEFDGLMNRFEAGPDGWTFRTTEELGKRLAELGSAGVEHLPQGRHEMTWEAGWEAEAWPKLKRLLTGSAAR